MDNNVENTVSTEEEVVETTPTVQDAEPNKPAEVTEVVEETNKDTEPNKKTAPKRGLTKADLQAQIDALQNELNGYVGNSAEYEDQLAAKDTEISTLKGDIEKARAEIDELKKAVTTVIEGKKSKLPDNIKALMPENQSTLDTLNWILKAEGNAPAQATPTAPEVEIGRVIPVDTTQINKDTNLSAYDKMTSAFAQLFSK